MSNDKLIKTTIHATQIATLEKVVQEITGMFNKYRQDLSIGMILNFYKAMVEEKHKEYDGWLKEVTENEN